MDIIELFLDEENEHAGIEAVSLVSAGAIESDFIALKNQEFKDKKPICVFRGSATGCGITDSTNMRIKACMMSYDLEKNGIEILDAKLTGWNRKPGFGPRYDIYLLCVLYPDPRLHGAPARPRPLSRDGRGPPHARLGRVVPRGHAPLCPPWLRRPLAQPL